MTFWKRPEFKALQEAWYQRLDATGFQDAEELIGFECVLRQTAHHAYRGTDDLMRDTKADYYHLVSQKVQETDFGSAVDRLILTRHAEGKKHVHICAELALLGLRRNRKTVRFRIRIYEMQWGLKTYTARQLNRKVG